MNSREHTAWQCCTALLNSVAGVPPAVAEALRTTQTVLAGQDDPTVTLLEDSHGEALSTPVTVEMASRRNCGVLTVRDDQGVEAAVHLEVDVGRDGALMLRVWDARDASSYDGDAFLAEKLHLTENAAEAQPVT